MTSNDAGYQDHDTVTDHDHDHDVTDHEHEHALPGFGHDPVADSDAAVDQDAATDPAPATDTNPAPDTDTTDDDTTVLDGEPVGSHPFSGDPGTDDDSVSGDLPATTTDPTGTTTDASTIDDSSGDVLTPEPLPVTPDLAPSVAPVAASAGTPADADSDWRELQGRFVDDPAAAVHEAGDRVEQALAALRARVETGSTEDLRTAFRRYRELNQSLR